MCETDFKIKPILTARLNRICLSIRQCLVVVVIYLWGT